MFWKHREGEEKLPGPKAIPGPVQKHLINERKMNPDAVNLLKAVVRKSPKGERAFAIRIFDESEAGARKVPVKSYISLDERSDLIIYEGWFDEGAKCVELEEKKKVVWDTPILSEAEIRQKIEGLSQPGSTLFFYLGASPNWGGPMGRGAAVIELNPNYPGKGQKKYNVGTADVIDGQPVGKGQKLFDSDKPKDVAAWVGERQKRSY
ncbi:MAG: hypothetical protein HY668_01795 [Chloroflexi bacterium]|nr:hypothetical protein [Chloroflexota bacterium]